MGKLKFLVVSALGLFTIMLASCNTNTINPETHIFKLASNDSEHYYQCECGETKDYQAHTYGDYIITLAATCTKVGSKYRECTVCHYQSIEEIPALGHVEEIIVGIDADCAHTGLTEGKRCSRYGVVLEERKVIEQEKHQFSDYVVEVKETCTSDGLESHTCKICNYKETRSIPHHEHTPIDGNGKTSTCTETGLTNGIICSECGITIESQEVIAVLNHDFSEYETEIEEKCLSDGLESRVCKDCGFKETRTIKGHGHTPKVGIAFASTCDMKGHTAGIYCEECGIWIEEQEVNEMLPHEYREPETVKEANYLEEGLIKYVCNSCLAEFTESTPKLEFDFSAFDASLDIDTFLEHTVNIVIDDPEKLASERNITLINYNNISYMEDYNSKNKDLYKYYILPGETEIIESCMGGYRHRKYNGRNNQFSIYESILVMIMNNAGTYFDQAIIEGNTITFKDFDCMIWPNRTEKASIVTLTFNKEGKCESFYYKSDKKEIDVKVTYSASTINLPTATFHTYTEFNANTKVAKCYCGHESNYEVHIYDETISFTYYYKKGTSSSIEQVDYTIQDESKDRPIFELPESYHFSDYDVDRFINKWRYSEYGNKSSSVTYERKGTTIQIYSPITHSTNYYQFNLETQAMNPIKGMDTTGSTSKTELIGRTLMYYDPDFKVLRVFTFTSEDYAEEVWYSVDIMYVINTGSKKLITFEFTDMNLPYLFGKTYVSLPNGLKHTGEQG